MASFLITFGIIFRYFFGIDFCMPFLMPFLRLLVQNGRRTGPVEISTLPILPLRSAPFSRPFPKIDFLMHFGRPLAHFWLLFGSRWLPFGSLWLTFGAFFLRRCRGSLPISRFPSPCFKWPVSLGCGGVALRLQSAAPKGVRRLELSFKRVLPP